MKRHLSWIFIFVSVLIFSVASSTQAFLFKGNVEKAREYIKANMVDKAVEVLKEEIEKKPTNAEAHFELGSIYLDQGLYREAEERFKGAVGLNDEFTPHVAQKYMKSGAALMKMGNYQDAISRFKMAVTYQPSLKSEIAEQCFNKATEILDRIKQNRDHGALETDAHNYFKIAYALNRSVGGDISDAYFNACNSRDKPCFDFYRRAHEFSTKHDNEIIQILMVLYNSKEISKNHKSEIRQEVKSYVSDKKYNELFPPPPPDYKIYPRGTHKLKLAANQITDLRIMHPTGTYCDIDSSDNMFIFIYPNGKTLNAWELKSMPDEDGFWIKAVTDQNLTITVR